MPGAHGPVAEWLPNWPIAGRMSGRRGGSARSPPRSGFVQLERLLADRTPYGAVIPIDWGQFPAATANRGGSGFLRRAGARGGKPPEHLAIGRCRGDAGTLAGAAARAPPPGAHDAVDGASACCCSGTTTPSPLTHGFRSRKSGVDSLMAVELRNILVRSGGDAAARRPCCSTIQPSMRSPPALGVLWDIDEMGPAAVKLAVERSRPARPARDRRIDRRRRPKRCWRRNSRWRRRASTHDGSARQQRRTGRVRSSGR